MIDYWHYTGDETYNDVTLEGMQFQVGENADYAPKNWSLTLGNDDQSFWALSAMLAAEVNFRDPPLDKPQWVALAQAVWNEQAGPEHHDSDCGGGIRWQVYPTNRGYDYKNSKSLPFPPLLAHPPHAPERVCNEEGIRVVRYLLTSSQRTAIANACFFDIGARLARYEQNATYADWATKTWDWIQGVGYIDKDWNVYDGGHVPYNCTDINTQQYSYNAAILLSGASYMYDFVGTPYISYFFSCPFYILLLRESEKENRTM